jgi:hypothetical protein
LVLLVEMKKFIAFLLLLGCWFFPSLSASVCVPSPFGRGPSSSPSSATDAEVLSRLLSLESAMDHVRALLERCASNLSFLFMSVNPNRRLADVPSSRPLRSARASSGDSVADSVVTGAAASCVGSGDCGDFWAEPVDCGTDAAALPAGEPCAAASCVDSGDCGDFLG